MFLRSLRRFGACTLVVVAMLPVSVAGAAVSNEEVAMSLATLLRSARAIISDKQKHINNPDVGDKGFTVGLLAATAGEDHEARASEADREVSHPSIAARW